MIVIKYFSIGMLHTAFLILKKKKNPHDKCYVETEA